MVQRITNEKTTKTAVENLGRKAPVYAAFTKALSNEWAAKGISVNVIAPGYIATEMNTALMEDEERAKSNLGRIPAGRWGRAEDFKGPVMFLASAAS